MATPEKEIDVRCTKFQAELEERLQGSVAASKNSIIVGESYKRIISYGALYFGINQHCSKESLIFFKEAHNDMLTGHILAQLGSYRSALVALRSTIESVFHFLYYKDHPVEMALWLAQKHRMKFTALFEYENAKTTLFGQRIQHCCTTITKEYAELSSAVHGSASSFQMTSKDGFPNAIGYDSRKFSMWNTCARNIHNPLVELILHNFQACFEGTKLAHQREVITLSLSDATAKAINDSTKISLLA